jgi:hypothetical protein
MSNIERKWIGVGTGALGALVFDDEATALQYAQDCGAGEVVEYVPADQLTGAVSLDELLDLDVCQMAHEAYLHGDTQAALRTAFRAAIAKRGQ